MKKIITIILLSANAIAFSQTTKTEAEIDDIKKNKIIYANSTERTSYTVFSDGSRTRPARGLSVDFKVGEDGYSKNIGKKGKNLRELIKNDSEALAMLNKAYNVHLRKKRIYNTLEGVCYAAIVGAAIPLFLGADNYEDEGVNGLIVGGGLGVGASLIGIISFHKLTDKEMDRWLECVLKSIEIYNNNLLTK